MSQPQAHPTYSPARSACGPSGDKRGQRPPHHHTLCLLGSASEIQRDPLGFYSRILISPSAVHRHPAWWGEPERFDPERFTPERSAARPAYAYFPFGGEPRVCIGNSFAMIEAQLILATVAQRYQLRLLPGHRVELQMVVTLRPRSGLPMTIHATERAGSQQ